MDSAEKAPSHVLVLATLDASERRHVLGRRRRNPQPEPEPSPVTTTRATIVDVGAPLTSEDEARKWFAGAGEDHLSADVAVLNRALHAHGLVSTDPYARSVRPEQAIVARIGFGAGEQVADGQWTAARELVLASARRRRSKMLAPEARLAAILTGRERALVCEDLALRARMDLDQGRGRQAALQLMIALDGAIAELPADPTAELIEDRIAELRTQRDPVSAAAQSALAGPLSPEQLEVVALALGRLEAALRARAAAAR